MMLVEILIGTGLIVVIALAFHIGYRFGQSSKKN
jgi:hypothetical protein